MYTDEFEEKEPELPLTSMDEEDLRYLSRFVGYGIAIFIGYLIFF